MSFARSTIAIVLFAATGMLAQGCVDVPPQMNDKQFRVVQQGMTTDEVRNALGPPKRTMKFPASGKEAWDYDGTDTMGYMVEYSVTFTTDGRVDSKLTRRINDGGNMK